MKNKNERLKGQVAVIVVFLLLPLFAFLTIADIQPHREHEALQVVTGEVGNIRVRNYHRSPHRPSVTRLLVNDTWYEAPGRYAVGHLLDQGGQVRLRVDGANIWMLQTDQGTLLPYETLAKRYQRQRWVNYGILLVLAGCLILLTVLQVKSLKRGDSPFSPKKN